MYGWAKVADVELKLTTEGADEIDPHHVLEIGQCGVGEVRRPEDPGRVDEGVQPAHRRHRFGHAVLDRGLVADVHLHRRQPAAVPVGLGRRVLQPGFTHVGGGDAATLVEDAEHGGLSDTRSAAGDQDAAVGVALK